MLKDHEPDQNIEEITDEEIYSVIHYLEPGSQYNERQEEQNDVAVSR